MKTKNMKNKNLTFALVIPHYKEMFYTFYTMEIIKGIRKGAYDEKVDLLIHISHDKNFKDSPYWLFDKKIISGILFADVLNNEYLLQQAKKKKIDYLILNYFDVKSKDNCIGIDNKDAAYKAAKFLIDLGHRHIATISGKLYAQAGKDRLEGYKKALKESGISVREDYIVEGDWSKDSGAKAVKELLGLTPRPTAVFASGDEMAIGAIKQAEQAGLKVPGDISFVGFDDVPEAESPKISLTTMKQPLEPLGELGVQNLKKIVEKKAKKPIKLLLKDTQLIIRGSARKL